MEILGTYQYHLSPTNNSGKHFHFFSYPMYWIWKRHQFYWLHMCAWLYACRSRTWYPTCGIGFLGVKWAWPRDDCKGGMGGVWSGSFKNTHEHVFTYKRVDLINTVLHYILTGHWNFQTESPNNFYVRQISKVFKPINVHGFL